MEIEKEFWMIYVENRSSPTKRHYTYDSAFEEAKRLASDLKNIKSKVYILRATGCLVQELAPIKYTKLD